MRRIFTNVLFRIGLLIIGVLILFSGSKTTTGFSWFGVRTQTKNEAIKTNKYIAKETMTDVIMEVISVHTKIAGGLQSVVAADNMNTNSIPSFLANSQRLLYTDIISYLENAGDKATALDSYTSQLGYYQGIGATYTMDLQNTIQEQTALYNSCGAQKTVADTMFYQGLYGGDEQEVMQGLSDSQTNGMCQTKARITMNAYKAMLTRVQNVQSTLTNLSSVLTQNRSTIISNFDLFKDSYLEKLITVRNQLRAYSPGTTVN